MNLSDLFADEDYRLQMRFEHGNVADFFAPTEHHAELISQRCDWLRSSPRTYAALLTDGVPLLEQTIEMAANWGINVAPAASPEKTLWQRCLALGEALEPDFLLLKPRAGGQFHLLGGCVCFPSSWSLAEKIGHPLEFIHGVVPDLNAQLGNQIHGFLCKIKPDIAWQRTNWGLSRSPDLNQHPERKLLRLDSSVRLDEVWLRVEHQALVALPKSRGILFGIRIAVHPLAELKNDAAMASRLSRALETMPHEMARYKNLTAARSTIVTLLRS